VIYDLPVVVLGNAVHFHRVRLIDEIEQRRERMTEIETAATAVTDIENPFEFLEQRVFVVKLV
jgi:hypothetical protein